MRQALSDKRVRRYARLTGLPIQRMLARGGSGHWIAFRIVHDRHGRVNTSTLEVIWDNQHWSSCKEDFRNRCPWKITR